MCFPRSIRAILSASSFRSRVRLLRASRVFAGISNDCIISATREMEPLAAHAFADCSVCLLTRALGDNSRRVTSLSPGAQLSSCNLLHFFPTNRIAERLEHYVYIQGYTRCMLAVPRALSPSDKGSSPRASRPIHRRMSDGVQCRAKILAAIGRGHRTFKREAFADEREDRESARV